MNRYMCLAMISTAALVFAVSALGSGSENLNPGVDYLAGEVLVKLSAGSQHAPAEDADVRRFIESITPGAEEVTRVFLAIPGDEIAERSGLDRWYRVHYAGAADVSGKTKALAYDPGVEAAEPNYIGHIASWPNDGFPNDSLFIDSIPDGSGFYKECQWALYNDDGQCYNNDGAVPDCDIDADSAWYVSVGSDSVKIAVIDTGVDTDHPDLASKIIQQDCYCNASGTPCCPNGQSEQHGVGAAEDDHGHGTAVSGIAVANTNNTIGIAGVCPLSSLIIVKVVSSSGISTATDLSSGIIRATDSGAAVINISLGFPPSAIIADAVAYSVAHDVVVVAAAGNSSSSEPLYPAAYPGVLAVAAITYKNVRNASSNYGDWVDVAAPGYAIYSTRRGGGYGTSGQTSIAAPHVAGEAGLLRSLYPSMPKSVADSLIKTCVDPVVPNPARPIGGRMNMHKALLGAMALAGVDPGESVTGFDVQTHPNPSSGTFLIRFELARSSLCKVCVYDVRGRLVKTLKDGPAREGPNELAWDGEDSRGRPAAAGAYFCRVEAGGAAQTRKIVLAR